MKRSSGSSGSMGQVLPFRAKGEQMLKPTVQELPLMVRELDGSIVFWNRLAEQQYGWSCHQALGNISHQLLNTIFPSPLQEINRQLLEAGFWEGELIHTVNDGLRVKVKSRWELQPTPEGGLKVVEINRVQEVVTPESAHLSGNLSKYFHLFWDHRWWFLLPFLVVLVVMWMLHHGADHQQILPLLE